MSQPERLTTFEVKPKRSAEKVPISFDLHDYLAQTWQEGVRYDSGVRIRGTRKLSTGYEYEATTPGTSGRARPNFPRTLGATVADGSVVWTARAITSASLRATVSSSTFPSVTGIILSDESNADLVYTVHAAAGTNGQWLEVKHLVTLSNAPGEIKESVAVLPIVD